MEELKEYLDYSINELNIQSYDFISSQSKISQLIAYKDIKRKIKEIENNDQCKSLAEAGYF